MFEFVVSFPNSDGMDRVTPALIEASMSGFWVLAAFVVRVKITTLTPRRAEIGHGAES